jgi:hypothetical protein
MSKLTGSPTASMATSPPDPLRQFHHVVDGVSIGAVDQIGRYKLLGDR